MRKLLVVLLLFPTLFFAQMKLDTINKTVSFSKVYKVKASKAIINQRAKEWIAINFKDANEVIKLNTESKIIAKGYFNVTNTSGGYAITSKIFFILEIAFKDGRYKMDMHSFKIIKDGIDYPMDGHFFNSDYNNYVKSVKKLRDEATQKFYKKFYTKLLLNEKKMTKLFTKQQKISVQIKTKITNEVEGTANSLYNYISQNNSDDW